MQTDNDVQNLIHSTAFQSLLRKKVRVTFCLSAVMLVVYSFYFIAIGWFPEWMGSTSYQQGTISNGIWLTVGCVIFSVLISGFYIWWANNYYDKSMQGLLRNTSNAKD